MFLGVFVFGYVLFWLKFMIFVMIMLFYVWVKIGLFCFRCRVKYELGCLSWVILFGLVILSLVYKCFLYM